MPAEFERTVESGSVTELGGVMAGRAVVSGGRDILLTLKAKSNLLDQL